MDLSSIIALDTAPVAIKHPKTGRATGIVIYLASKDSQTFRDAMREVQSRAMKREEEFTPEEAEREVIALLSACVTGWEEVQEGGTPLECTPENVKRVLSAYPWIRRQVDAAWGDETRFFAVSKGA